MKKKLLSILLTGVMLIMMAGCGVKNNSNEEETKSSAEAEQPAEPSKADTEEVSAVDGGSKVINIWGWETYEQQKEEFERFEELTGIKVEMTMVESKDMPVRIQTALASGADMPDIVWIEMGVRGKMLALDCWEVLTDAPYNMDTSLLFDSMIPLGTNEKGEFVGLDDGPSMAGLAYKRDLAKEYFGTDDPAELEQMFTDWNVFIEKGKEVKEKSGGSVYMLPSLNDAMTILKGQSNIPFAEGDILQLDESLGGSFDILIQMKDSGIVDTMEMNSPSYYASIAEKNHIFLPCAYWGPRWVIDMNDPENKNSWGLMVPPEGGYGYGGTCWSIPKTAKNKEGAWELLSWLYLSKEGGEIRRDAYNYTVPLKELYDGEFYSAENPHFAGQDTLKYFTSVIAPSVTASRQVYKYDSEISDAISLAVTTLNAAEPGEMAKEDLVKIVEDDVLSKVPALSTK